MKLEEAPGHVQQCNNWTATDQAHVLAAYANGITQL